MASLKKLAGIFILNLLFIASPGLSFGQIEEIPFIPTPMEVVDRMLEIAEVKSGDVVYDLGSGDGRIIIRAAKKYGARGVGIEADPQLIELSRTKAREEGVSHLVEFRAEDALKVDLSAATVVTLYMFPWFNEKLKPVLENQLKPSARVVSHDFPIEGWRPTRVITLPEVERTPGGTCTGTRSIYGRSRRSPHMGVRQICGFSP